MDTGKIRWSDPADPILRQMPGMTRRLSRLGRLGSAIKLRPDDLVGWWRGDSKLNRPGLGASERRLDGNGTLSTFEVTSEKPEVFRHNENYRWLRFEAPP